MKSLSFILLLLSVAAMNVFGQEPNDLIADGNNFYRKQDYFKAELQYRKALETDPNNREAKFNLANTLLKQQKNAEAEKLLIELNNDQSKPIFRSEVNYNNGVRLTGEKKLEESIEAYKETLRLNPNDQEARENLQKALLELKKKQSSNKQQQQKKQQEKPKPKMSQQDVDKQLKNLEKKEMKVNQRNQKKNQVSQPKDW